MKSMTTGRRGGRDQYGWLRAAGLAVGMSLVLASCYSRGALDHQAASPDTRPYYCDGVGDGTPPAGAGHDNGGHVESFYEGMEKGPLSWDDCLELSAQLDLLYDAVDDLQTAGDAEAAGWTVAAPYIPGLGTHHVRPGFNPVEGPAPTFEVTEPHFLIYGGNGPDAPLIGVSYELWGTDNDSPPDAFAGTNDWWHLHTKICLGAMPSTGVDQVSDEECAARGGRQIPIPNDGHWMLHLWIGPGFQTKWDIFTSGHPCLGEAGPLPQEDPCWDIVNHEPADGPLPGSEHDEHGH